MISRQVEKRHLEAFDEAVEFIPLASYFFLVSLAAASGDQVAYGDDEFGLQLIDLFHGSGKHSGAQAAGSVGDDGKLKIIGIVAKCSFGPRFFVSGDAVSEMWIGLGMECGPACGEDDQNWDKELHRAVR